MNSHDGAMLGMRYVLYVQFCSVSGTVCIKAKHHGPEGKKSRSGLSSSTLAWEWCRLLKYAAQEKQE